MSDAGEVLLTIYERIQGVSTEAAAAVDAAFGLRVAEAVHCGACGRVTHQTSYTQYFYNTQVGDAWCCGVLHDTACGVRVLHAAAPAAAARQRI